MEEIPLFGLDTNLWSSEYNNPPQSSPIEVEEAVKRAIKDSIPSMVEAVTQGVQVAVTQGMQAAITQGVQAAVTQGVQAAITQEMQAAMTQGVQAAMTPVVEGVLRGMQVCPPKVDDISKRMAHTAQPYLQNLTQPSSSCSRSLHFVGQLPERFYTYKKLNDHEGFSLKVELRDESGNIVNVGAESSRKISIVVLPGDFKVEDNYDLAEGLDTHVTKAREGKPQLLLVGKYEVNLDKGVAHIGDFKFTDNSSWTRSNKFRLGAKFEGRVSDGVFVREAISDAIEVKERRGEAGQKIKNPTLDDKLWKLNGITKNGQYCKRLEEKGIKDVRALLNLYDINPQLLKEILKVSNSKTLQEIINHAAIARSSVGALNVQNTSTAVGINATYFTNGNQTGFYNVQGANSETSIPIGNIDPAIHSISNLQNYEATADSPISDFNIEEFWASNEFRTKFSPRWGVIRAAKRVISLRIMIASRPQKKRKI